MKARRLLSPFLVIPCCVVSGFDLQSSNALRRKRSVNSLLQQQTAQTSARESLDTEESTDSTAPRLPPIIQQIADERVEFQLNLGKAMDTLRSDMSDILAKKPGASPPSISFEQAQQSPYDLAEEN
jgi:hypothetical protein